MSFWDSSAIVPLCLNEERSSSARRLWRLLTDHTVWREVSVEVSSTLARLEREQILDEAGRIRSERRFLLVEKDLRIVDSSDRLTELARVFPQVYGLRSLDSLQLAAALVWCKEFPKNKNFVSADARLLDAAENVGFKVHEL